MSSSGQKIIKRGFLLVMLVAFFWSMDGILLRPKLNELPPLLVVFFEYLVGLVFLIPIAIKNRKKIMNLSYKDITSIILIGVFGGMLGTTAITYAFFAALKEGIPLSTVIILQKLQPFFVIFLAYILLKERLPRRFYFWAVISVIAAYFLSIGDYKLIFTGISFNNAVIFAVIAAFAYASSTVFDKRLLNHLDYKTAASLRYIATIFFVFILINITGDIKEIVDISFAHTQLLLMIGILSVVGFVIYYYALKITSASLTTIGELFWSLSAITLDYFINGNVLTLTQGLAVVVLLTSFYFISQEAMPKLPSFKSFAIPNDDHYYIKKRVKFNTVKLDYTSLDIDHGVYHVIANIKGIKYNGLLFFGYSETFKTGPHLELYLPEFVGSFYGVMIYVQLIKRIRDIKKFNDEAELMEQIRMDIKQISN